MWGRTRTRLRDPGEQRDRRSSRVDMQGRRARLLSCRVGWRLGSRGDRTNRAADAALAAPLSEGAGSRTTSASESLTDAACDDRLGRIWLAARGTTLGGRPEVERATHELSATISHGVIQGCRTRRSQATRQACGHQVGTLPFGRPCHRGARSRLGDDGGSRARSGAKRGTRAAVRGVARSAWAGGPGADRRTT